MTLRAQRAICLALVVVGTVLGFWLVDDAWSVRDEVQGKTHNLTRELDDKQRVASSHDQARRQLEDMLEMRAMLVRRLPSHIDVPAMEKVLREQAALAGIQITSPHMGEEKGREFYAYLPVEFVAEGSTAQLLNFMDAVLHAPPLRIINSMKIEPVEGAHTLRATMTLIYYRYVEDDG